MSQDNRSIDAKGSAQDEVTSAFFDEEHAEHESFDSWLSDDQTVQRWYRYSIISSAMKNDIAAAAPIDISQRVSAAIAAEPNSKVVSVTLGSRSKAARRAANRWFQPVAKVAVAAGVAVVAVMTVQTYQTPEAMPAAQEPALITNPLGGRQPVSYSPATSANPLSAQQQDMQLRRQAQSYLIDHQQQVLLLQTGKSDASLYQQAEQQGNDSEAEPQPQQQQH